MFLFIHFRSDPITWKRKKKHLLNFDCLKITKFWNYRHEISNRRIFKPSKNIFAKSDGNNISKKKRYFCSTKWCPFIFIISKFIKGKFYKKIICFLHKQVRRYLIYNKTKNQNQYNLIVIFYLVWHTLYNITRNK